MIVAIHQPNLFPWLGFFDKMLRSDLFILLDTVPFTKGGYQNRVQVKGPTGAQWLTVPVNTSGRLGQPTNEVEVSRTRAWQKDHLKTFMALYGKTDGYHRLMPDIEAVYQIDSPLLVSFTLRGIELLKARLQIGTPLVRASALGVTGSGSQLLCDLVRRVGGTTYLSGPSGRTYLDEQLFHEQHIAVTYHQFESFVYSQRSGSFVPRLSALDYVLNEPDLHLWRAVHQCVSGS